MPLQPGGRLHTPHYTPNAYCNVLGGKIEMYSLLLGLIYIAFISLGLPDALLGSAWPSMYGELDAAVSYAGIISMIIAGGTIISSILSDRLIRRMGTGAVTALSVAMTAAALFGFSSSRTFLQLCIWGIPYGLGAGSVDAALNTLWPYIINRGI